MALVAQLPHPLQIHRSPVRATLAAHHQPVYAVQVEVGKRSQERLGADPTCVRRNAEKDVGSPAVIVTLDADAQPDVVVPWTPNRRQVIGDALGSLGEDLKNKVGAATHDLPRLLPPNVRI